MKRKISEIGDTEYCWRHWMNAHNKKIHFKILTIQTKTISF